MPAAETLESLLSDAELRERLARAPWRRFVVIGDSLIEGLGDPVEGFPSLPWPEAVTKVLTELHPDFVFLNLGRRFRLAREVRESQLGKALDFSPDLGCVLAGANDLLAEQFDPAALEEHLDAMVGALTQAGATVLTWSLPDATRNGLYSDEAVSFIQPRLEAFREVSRAVAERHDTLFFDYFDHPIAADPEMMSADLMHINMRGHAQFSKAVLQALGTLIPPARESDG